MTLPTFDAGIGDPVTEDQQASRQTPLAATGYDRTFPPNIPGSFSRDFAKSRRVVSARLIIARVFNGL
jgi:hypothetical protein